jgi:hypothetical protein
MYLLKATLVFVKRKETLTVATALADLEADDIDFLARHVSELRKKATEEDASLSRFHQGSGIPGLIGRLLHADEPELVTLSASLARRLQGSMDQSNRADPGVLAVIVTGEDQKPDMASILKLDAISEAASFKFVKGHVRLSVLRDLLPAPGHLQKGISWPDPRAGSDTIVIDRNQTTAHYFFNAFELEISSTPREAERALSEAIIRNVPVSKRAAVMRYAGSLSGPADQVATQVHERYPEVSTDYKELGAQGALGGFIRPNKVAGHMTRFRGDGINVEVPHDRLDRIRGPRRAGAGWELTIQFSTQPQEQST